MRELRVDVAEGVAMPVASMPPPTDVPGLGVHLDFLTQQEFPGYRDLAYSLLAMELALADAALTFDRQDNRVGMVQAFEAPGVESTVSRLFGLMSTPPPSDAPPRVYDLLAPSFYGMQAFIYVHLAGKAMGLHGFCTSVHNACSSGAYAIETAAQQIRNGVAGAMVVTGGEAFDTAVRLEWFRRLELYAKEPVMRPFDTESAGFYVGEGAGAIVLESAQRAKERGATIYARYLGGAFAHQGWKQTVPDVRAGRLRGVVTDALDAARVTAGDIDFIVPHGAATSLSDRYEANCIGGALGGANGNAVATAFKPYVGHTLAACGILDTICGLLSMKNGCVPATPHTRAGRASFPVPLAHEKIERPVRRLLKVFTGFTGHDAALVFEKA